MHNPPMTRTLCMGLWGNLNPNPWARILSPHMSALLYMGLETPLQLVVLIPKRQLPLHHHCQLAMIRDFLKVPRFIPKGNLLVVLSPRNLNSHNPQMLSLFLASF